MENLDDLIEAWEKGELSYKKTGLLVDLLNSQYKYLKKWQEEAFEAHPNIDLDIERLSA